MGDRAQRFLRGLVERRGLALRPGTRVRDLARRLGRVWAVKTVDEDEAGAELLAWLLEQEDVEEVATGELELRALARGE
jgi:hypothetical protein